MKTLLKDFKVEFRDRLLDLLWRQWTALGVSGQVSPWERTALDPEALLAISCTVGRHDPRLFDTMLDWMQVNGRYLNIHRMQRMLKTHPFAGGAVYAAAAAVASNPGQAAKWRRSSRLANSTLRSAEPLFRMADGKALPVLNEQDPVFQAHGFVRDRYETRGSAHPFNPAIPANLILRLRAFLGVNARCEILAYLLANATGSPRAVARACGFYPATITKALAEMSDSGYVISRVEGRHRHYTMASDVWHTLLIGKERLSWITWPPLFCALEQIWTYLNEPGRDSQSVLAQSSALRRVLRGSVADVFTVSGLPIGLGDIQPYTGETLIPVFITRMRQILDSIRQAAV